MKSMEVSKTEKAKTITKHIQGAEREKRKGIEKAQIHHSYSIRSRRGKERDAQRQSPPKHSCIPKPPKPYYHGHP